MISSSYLKQFIAGVAVLSLAGCLGSSNSGGGAAAGGGGGANPAAFKTAYDAALRPTQGRTLTPLSGTADYSGQVEILTNENPADTKEAIYGDLKMAVNFGANVKRPVSGTIGNFAGKFGGEDIKLDGTLSTANAKASDPNFVTSTEITLPAPASGTRTLTSMGGTFTGDLSDPDSKLTGRTELIVSGDFYGTGGEGIVGMAGGSVAPSSGAARIVGGPAYANKQ